MNDHVVDCCSFLNLYTGWGGFTESREFGRTWHICAAVLKESEFTREYGPADDFVKIEIDTGELAKSGLIMPAAPETEGEIEDYVNFAVEIDDGEAQALAIAKHRGFILLTDDRKAENLAAREDVAVKTISTALVLQEWAGLSQINAERLPMVLRRITELARFCPPKQSPDYEWWQRHLEDR